MSGVVLGTVRLLNQPPIKEGVKNAIGLITFFGGIAALYQISQAPKEKEASTWTETAGKAINFFLTVSIVLSLIASRPGLYFCGIVTPTRLAGMFGPNTIFAINPWHPRHILNITANVLSATALIKWVFNKYAPSKETLGLIITIGAFNFLTGRSTLHLVNDFWYFATHAQRV